MLEQLTQIIQQYGSDAVVKNNAIPNEHNDAVLNETGNSIFESLKNLASQNDMSQIAGLLQAKNLDQNNPLVQQITQNVSGSLSEKFGLSQDVSNGAASSMIPQILSSLIGKANDPKDGSFSISDLLGALAGGNTAQNNGIMEAISTYGVHFGLDQNADGKVDLEDAAELSKKGGLAGIFGKLFGK
ncbi:hypothetical protein [Flavobacterium agrisoli]|uniref:Uncharacterized protein n=1 Tax=Flavobacterium agrisoli TaxID=2793066 RepID=A0A934PNG7_9FLAO|nr:hypothetical protein [Flavobacterium agrisoli]MBK0370024.1 hypothetical protein [Flavobacterium agrisoli]